MRVARLDLSQEGAQIDLHLESPAMTNCWAAALAVQRRGPAGPGTNVLAQLRGVISSFDSMRRRNAA